MLAAELTELGKKEADYVKEKEAAKGSMPKASLSHKRFIDIKRGTLPKQCN